MGGQGGLISVFGLARAPLGCVGSPGARASWLRGRPRPKFVRLRAALLQWSLPVGSRTCPTTRSPDSMCPRRECNLAMAMSRAQNHHRRSVLRAAVAHRGAHFGRWPRANFILANQNGLRINGGSFVNFGSVALTTGAVALRDELLTQGGSQRYVDLATQRGDIQIEGKGWMPTSSALSSWRARWGCPGPSPTRTVRRPGSRAWLRVFRPPRSTPWRRPRTTWTPWAYHSKPKDAPVVPASAIAVDVSANSTITSGRIEILVTDQRRRRAQCRAPAGASGRPHDQRQRHAATAGR